MEISPIAERYQNWKKQTFTSEELKHKFREKQLPIPTYRPIEMIFATTNKRPEDLNNKTILNIGSGKTHYGFELSQKYHKIAKKFENFDISFTKQAKLRRLTSKLFLAETVGDAYDLPYNDNSFDLIWTSYALPINNIQSWQEIIRITKPNGEIFMLGGNPTTEIATELSKKLKLKVKCQTISADSVKTWIHRAPKKQKFLTTLIGKTFLTAKKPLPNPQSL